jgi:hypothetical protein
MGAIVEEGWRPSSHAGTMPEERTEEAIDERCVHDERASVARSEVLLRRRLSIYHLEKSCSIGGFT